MGPPTTFLTAPRNRRPARFDRRSMAFRDPLPTTPVPTTPARRVVPLGRGWAAVLVQLAPGAPVAAIGLFRRWRLVEVADEPAEVARLTRQLWALSPD